MRKALAVSAVALLFVASVVCAQKVHDWHDLDEVHKHVDESIHEMEKARAANHYDMQGHGAKAEDHLRAAEKELGLAVEAAKQAK